MHKPAASVSKSLNTKSRLRFPHWAIGILSSILAFSENDINQMYNDIIVQCSELSGVKMSSIVELKSDGANCGVTLQRTAKVVFQDSRQCGNPRLKSRMYRNMHLFGGPFMRLLYIPV